MEGASAERRFEFSTTPALEVARQRRRFVTCPVCGSDREHFLFYRMGARFVRCRVCDAVYVNPARSHAQSYFDIATFDVLQGSEEHRLAVADFDAMLQQIEQEHLAVRGRPPGKVLLVGR